MEDLVSSTTIQSKLLRKASRLLVAILGGISTSSAVEKTLASSHLVHQLSEVLGEITALWEKNSHDLNLLYQLSACAVEVEAVLETSCDFLYRLTVYSKF